MSWCWNQTCSHSQAYGFIEIFSGQGWVTKHMKANGVPSASFDIDLGKPVEGKQDAMDILTDPGFSFLGKKSGQAVGDLIFFPRNHELCIESMLTFDLGAISYPLIYVLVG